MLPTNRPRSAVVKSKITTKAFVSVTFASTPPRGLENPTDDVPKEAAKEASTENNLDPSGTNRLHSSSEDGPIVKKKRRGKRARRARLALALAQAADADATTVVAAEVSNEVLQNLSPGANLSQSTLSLAGPQSLDDLIASYAPKPIQTRSQTCNVRIITPPKVGKEQQSRKPATNLFQPVRGAPSATKLLASIPPVSTTECVSGSYSSDEPSPELSNAAPNVAKAPNPSSACPIGAASPKPTTEGQTWSYPVESTNVTISASNKVEEPTKPAPAHTCSKLHKIGTALRDIGNILLEIGGQYPGERADWLAKTLLNTPATDVSLQNWMKNVANAASIAMEDGHFGVDREGREKDAVLGMMLLKHEKRD